MSDIPAFIEFVPSACSSVNDEVDCDDMMSVSSAESDYSDALVRQPASRRASDAIASLPDPEDMTDVDLRNMALKIQSIKRKLGGIRRDARAFAFECDDMGISSRGTSPQTDAAVVASRVHRRATLPEDARGLRRSVQSDTAALPSSRVGSVCCLNSSAHHFVSMETSSVMSPPATRLSPDCVMAAAMQPSSQVEQQTSSNNCTVTPPPRGGAPSGNDKTSKDHNDREDASTSSESEDGDDDETFDIDIISVTDIDLSGIPDLPFGRPPEGFSF